MSVILANSSGRHGHTWAGGQSPTYVSWQNMRRRCDTPTNNAYARYGAKGITVCGRWNRFENFLEDMGERPPGLTIDRVDSAKGYSPDNCRWATRADQTRNRRATLLTAAMAADIRVARRTGESVAGLATQYGVSTSTIYKIDQGRTWQ